MKRKILLISVYCSWLLSAQGVPDFMIIGVPKCGTTSLYNYMLAHPQILGASRKELHFFDRNFHNGMQWYDQQFPSKKSQKMLTGEATPAYFWKAGCAKKIARYYPNTKLIIIFRDPVKRAVSQYLMRLSRTREKLSFDQSIKQHGLWAAYIGAGLYVEHLSRWLSLFPKQQIHILFLEDLSAHPEEELNKVFTFLGLKKYTLDSYEIYNKAKKKIEGVSQQTIDYLKKFYEPYDKKLEQFLGRKLPWKQV